MLPVLKKSAQITFLFAFLECKNKTPDNSTRNLLFSSFNMEKTQKESTKNQIKLRRRRVINKCNEKKSEKRKIKLFYLQCKMKSKENENGKVKTTRNKDFGCDNAPKLELCAVAVS